MKHEALPNGEYWAMCRERNVISAAANGHSQVFPKARMTVKDGWAFFQRDGVEVWTCNAVSQCMRRRNSTYSRYRKTTWRASAPHGRQPKQRNSRRGKQWRPSR
ncbi:hypothetical protein, partial [Burkholderia ubonensis]|uniref:hypothetical protein n=1 Tax=Burkholderia ubonensis TaxID=101571 RepID=UPI002FC6D377